MSDYSDAALLKGRFAHMNKQLRIGRQAAETRVDWNRASCETTAEEAAQEVAKHIFAFSQALDPETERMEVVTHSALGPVKVLGIVPGENDIIRVDGLDMNNQPTAIVMHSAQMSLTFVRRPAEEVEDDDDGMQIGFVIFDELQERQNQREKEKAGQDTPDSNPEIAGNEK